MSPARTYFGLTNLTKNSSKNVFLCFSVLIMSARAFSRCLFYNPQTYYEKGGEGIFSVFNLGQWVVITHWPGRARISNVTPP